MQNKIRLLASLLLFFLFFLSVAAISAAGCGTEGNFKIIEESHQSASGVELVFIEKTYDGCGNTQIYLANLGGEPATIVTGTGMGREPIAWSNKLGTGRPTTFLEPDSITLSLFFVEDFRGKAVDPIKISAFSAEGATAEATVVLESTKINPRMKDLIEQGILVLLVLLPILGALCYKFFKRYIFLDRKYAIIIIAGLWILLFFLYVISSLITID